MAVDYIHRFVVVGSPAKLRAFQSGVGRTVRRAKLGRVPGWREHVPLSFAAMYAICPELRRVEAELPADPYDLSAWPIARRPDGRSELRYRCHTRNLELYGFLRVLSRKFAALRFVLVTFCLDDNSIESHLIANGRRRKYTLPEARHDWHWEQARHRFHAAGDEIYEDDEARYEVEEQLLDEALDHWDRRIARSRKRPASRAGTPGRAMTPSGPPRDWWDRPSVRDLDLERNIAIMELFGQRKTEAAARRPKPQQPKRAAAGASRPKGSAGRKEDG